MVQCLKKLTKQSLRRFQLTTHGVVNYFVIMAQQISVQDLETVHGIQSLCRNCGKVMTYQYY